MSARPEHASRRVRRRAAPLAPPYRGPHDVQFSPYDPLVNQSVEILIDGAFELLATSGAAFEVGSEALDILIAAGFTATADGVVYMPRDRVKAALASTAKSTQLWNRDGTASITLDCHHSWFLPGMTCIRVYDRASGLPRSSTAADLAEITRVADALVNIDAVCVACKDIENSDWPGELGEFITLVQNTNKPLEFLCEQPATFRAVIEVAALVRGSHAALRAKPYFLQLVTPLPLNYHAAHTDQIIDAVRAGIPVSVGTLPIGGASTPITTAGSIVNSLATDFAAMVLAQTVVPGAFCIGSSDVCFMEPATGSIGNPAQTALADMMMCQIRRRLDLPSFTGAVGYSSARRFNEDAVAEISQTLMQAFYSRPTTMDYLGSLDQGLTYSLHALLLADDIAGLLRTLWRGVRIDGDMMALDLAKLVGPRGNYLAHRHTVDHCRENLWPSHYFGPSLPLSSDLRPDADLSARIEADLCRILEEHHPAPLESGLLAQIEAVRARFAAQIAA